MGFWTSNSINLAVALCLVHCFGPDATAFAFVPSTPQLFSSSRLNAISSRVRSAYSSCSGRPSLFLKMREDSTEESTESDAEPVQLPDEDWRKFRAKLISQEAVPEKEAEIAWEKAIQRNTMVSERNWSPAVASPGQTWAHEVGAPEPGCLIIARPDFFGFSQHYFREAVICLVQHDETGSAGFILNRPTPYKIGAVTNKLPGFDNSPLYLGGDVGDGIQVMHGVTGMSGSKEIIDGVMMGIDPWEAKELLDDHKFSEEDFRFFYKYAGWAPGQLQAEIDRGVWYTAACSTDLILRQCIQLPKPLWREVLELMGGKYELISKATYGEL